jgi:ATP/maltotriose-dependent transcriptional regulator MalT
MKKTIASVKNLVLLLFVVTCFSAKAQPWNIDSVISTLETSLALKNTFEKVKLNKINDERIKFYQLNESDKSFKYKQAEILYEEYKSYHFDSAFHYALILKDLAFESRDPEKIAFSKIRMGFILLSSGLFKEAIDTMLTVDLKSTSEALRLEYYSNLGRMFHDLADYNKSSYYTPIYNHKGNEYLEKAIQLIEPGSVKYLMLRGAEQVKSEQFESARKTFHKVYENHSLTDHQRAIAASTLAYIYSCMKKDDPAIFYLAVAAIYDIRSTTRETVALRNLANLLYSRGDDERAYRYVKIALEDADFYNAQHRKLEVGNVLPIIEGQLLSRTENQKQQLWYFLAGISILVITAIVLLVITVGQYRKLRRVKELLVKSNHDLVESNKLLHESNRIKEKYIAYYFNINAGHIERIGRIQSTIQRKLSLKQYESLAEFVNHDLNLKKETQELNANFDKIVLSLFPHFVTDFNKLFDPEDKIVLKEGELLNNELRIFALIRMGISDNEKIARILNYSVNTIYTYKTRIRNKSKVSNNEFEEYLMKIDS